MKKLIASFILVMVTFMAIAQTPATFKFLGIPVDGKKSDVIAALKNKGFVYDAKNDVLKGRFNGMDSEIMISENYGKVDRIYVADEDECGEAQIIIRSMLKLGVTNPFLEMKTSHMKCRFIIKHTMPRFT